MPCQHPFVMLCRCLLEPLFSAPRSSLSPSRPGRRFPLSLADLLDGPCPSTDAASLLGHAIARWAGRRPAAFSSVTRSGRHPSFGSYRLYAQAFLDTLSESSGTMPWRAVISRHRARCAWLGEHERSMFIIASSIITQGPLAGRPLLASTMRLSIDSSSLKCTANTWSDRSDCCMPAACRPARAGWRGRRSCRTRRRCLTITVSWWPWYGAEIFQDVLRRPVKLRGSMRISSNRRLLPGISCAPLWHLPARASRCRRRSRPSFGAANGAESLALLDRLAESPGARCPGPSAEPVLWEVPHLVCSEPRPSGRSPLSR